MYFRLLRFLIAYVLCLMVRACVSMPEPERFDMTFESVSATVGTGYVTLVAELSADKSMVNQCGFLYGKSDDTMIKCQAQMGNGRFTKSINALDYQSEYVYVAYVGNGRHLMYSDKHNFITPFRPDISLSLSELSVRASGGIFKITVRHGKKYNVVIPKSVDWIDYSLEGDVCMLRVAESYSVYTVR